MDNVMKNLEDKMVVNLKEYMEIIKADYRAFFKGRNDEIAKKMIEEFENGLQVEVGSKYLKIITQNSVHSFICLKDGGKFAKGDILKAASWRAPAKNFPRGNLMKKDFSRVRWTGVM